MLDRDDQEVVVTPAAKVAVVSGGWSHEAHYSAASSVVDAIGRIGMEAVYLDYHSPRFLEEITHPSIDIVFPQTLGSYGEDGTLQGLLEYLGSRYVGCGPLASAVCANKLACVRFIRGLVGPDLPCATEGLLVSRAQRLSHEAIVSRLGSPFVFKPLSCGASFGLHLIASKGQYEACATSLIDEFEFMLAEPFHRGDEYSVGLLQAGDRVMALPPALVGSTAGGQVFDQDSKISRTPRFENLDQELCRRLRAGASAIAEGLGLCGFARLDLIVDERGVQFLEINTLPGLLPDHSVFPAMCLQAGIDYDRMIRMAIDSAFCPKPMQMRKLLAPPPRPAGLDQDDVPPGPAICKES